MTDFSKYQTLKFSGKSASEVYATLRADGLDQLAGVRMLREIYGLSLTDAKKISFEIDTGQSSEVSQPDLEKQFTEILKEWTGGH